MPPSVTRLKVQFVVGLELDSACVMMHYLFRQFVHFVRSFGQNRAAGINRIDLSIRT